MVSGAVALLMEHFRGQLGNNEIALRIVNTADNNDYSSDSRPDYSDSDKYGAGLLDLKSATEPVGNSLTGTQSRQASVASTRLTVPAAYGNPRHVESEESKWLRSISTTLHSGSL